jgi:hypothetical protein
VCFAERLALERGSVFLFWLLIAVMIAFAVKVLGWIPRNSATLPIPWIFPYVSF